MGNASISITPHRYSPQYDFSAVSGIYCVQWLTFKKDARALTALHWWRQKCLEWCYAYYEDGKFGDQKYLDDWPTRFEGVCVLEHLGCGVAPWNMQQYEFSLTQGHLVAKTFKLGLTIPVIFTHFHGLRYRSDDQFELGAYSLKKQVVRLIYGLYIRHLQRIGVSLIQKFGALDYHAMQTVKWSWKDPFRYLKRMWQGHYNIYPSSYFGRH
jgi:hypothetical protein